MVARTLSAAARTEVLLETSQEINVSLTPCGACAMTASAALALRPVNSMCAGLCAASSSTVPLPTPAVPVLDRGGVVSKSLLDVEHRIENKIRMPP